MQNIKSATNKTQIHIQDVLSIEISVAQNDTSAISLNDEQVKDFAEQWNSSQASGLCKYVPRFWIKVNLIDGKKRTFRTNAENIKENGDWCYGIDETEFFSRLWVESNN